MGYIQGILITVYLYLSYSQMVENRSISGGSLSGDQMFSQYNSLALPHKSSSSSSDSSSSSSPHQPPLPPSLASSSDKLSSSSYSSHSSSSPPESVFPSSKPSFPRLIPSQSFQFNSEVPQFQSDSPDPTQHQDRHEHPKSNRRRHKSYKHHYSHPKSYRNRSKNSYKPISPTVLADRIKNLDTKSIRRHNVRLIYLIPKCSHMMVEVKDSSVFANSSNTSNSQLRIYSFSIGRNNTSRGIHAVSIQGVESKKFICYEKGGKIISKADGERDVGCLFRETRIHSNYRQYRSLYNPNWLLGFNKGGKPIRGRRKNPKRHRNKDCFQFVKKLENIKSQSSFTHHHH
ncbi:head involution defective isoform X2 [Brevipalpus obovatus]|uniref:head involution defective isoform X2 n=1 Tax=Brevipalpus obovatus TaxID=246614 RepID=UPI003D9ED596